MSGPNPAPSPLTRGSFVTSPRGVALLSLLLLTFGLGSYGLLEDNEARFFEISWEMARSGDWLTPRLNFIDHFHKPPGTFWLVAGSLNLFGASEWAGRLPVALASLVTLALTWAWALREGGKERAVRSVLILVTSLEFWFLSRLVLTDMFLTVSVTAALFCAWRSRADGKRRYWLGFWVSLAASFMFKGPIGLAIVVPVLALFTLTSPIRQPWDLRPTVGIPLFLALSLPWYIIVCLQHNGLLGYFLKFQTAQRMLTTVHGRPGPWWFYLPALAGGFFPWSTGLPLTLFRAWKRKDDLDRLLLLWIVFPFLFFSCAGSKLPTYLLPIFPALALLTARQDSSTLRRLGTIALATLSVFAVALGAYLGHGAALELRPALWHLTALAVLLGASSLAAFAFGAKASPEARISWPALTWAAALLILASALGPCDRAYSAKYLAQVIRSQSSSGDIVEVADHLHGLPYYLGTRIVQISYPRETQFEPPDDYRDYLFPDLASYLAKGKIDGSPVVILRKSDYAAYADPSWPRQDIGGWVLLRPERPELSPGFSREVPKG